VRAGRPRVVGSVGRLVQLCGDDCHGRFVALRGFHLLAGRGVNLISDALVAFGTVSPNAVANAIDYAKILRRSRDAVICVYDGAGNLIETHEHKGDFKEW
jgi:hypothetical protein